MKMAVDEDIGQGIISTTFSLHLKTLFTLPIELSIAGYSEHCGSGSIHQQQSRIFTTRRAILEGALPAPLSVWLQRLPKTNRQLRDTLSAVWILRRRVQSAILCGHGEDETKW